MPRLTGPLGPVLASCLLALDASRVRIVRELALYLAFRNAVPASTAALVAALFLVQQAFVLVRAWLRVALLASERELVERLRPLPVAAPPPQPVVEPLPEPLPSPEPSA